MFPRGAYIYFIWSTAQSRYICRGPTSVREFPVGKALHERGPTVVVVVLVVVVYSRYRRRQQRLDVMLRENAVRLLLLYS